ncbi:MAG: HNH endonuclease family protein [Oscillospiraceae bacterium]|jgi:hypothetical protein
MKIELHEIPIRAVVEGYVNNDEEGVLGYSGKLNIRPKYQREFVYDEKRRAAVIETIRKDFPLNVMYWIKNGNGTFELMDGQQRTVSFCQYVHGDFSIRFQGKLQYFQNLTEPEQEQILDYKLLVYFCEGNETEKLEWFRVINIAGLQLKEQEMLNATHTGPWLTHAKSIFSKNNCPAYLLSKDYIKAEVNRQGLLEVALRWISNGEIENYMAIHQHDPNANELWTYFRNVINWVQLTFPYYRNEMKGLDWGGLYDRYKDLLYDTGKLEQEIKSLMTDDEVQKKSGIYVYVLTRNEKHLNLRGFLPGQKRAQYEKQNGICPHCGGHFDIKEMEADHIKPWSKGGRTVPENCQMLCLECNRRKSNK